MDYSNSTQENALNYVRELFGDTIRSIYHDEVVEGLSYCVVNLIESDSEVYEGLRNNAIYKSLEEYAKRKGIQELLI